MRRSRGFSLVELLFVLAILATVAGIIGVRMGAGIDADRLAVAARDVAATLRQASDRAQLSGRHHRVILSLATAQLAVEEEEDPLDAPEEWGQVMHMWGRTRRFERPIRYGELILDPDGEEPLVLDEESAELVGVVFDPEGVHWLSSEVIEDLDVEPEEGLAIQIQIKGTEDDGALYVRLEVTGEIRVWTEQQKTEYFEALDGAATTTTEGAGK